MSDKVYDILKKVERIIPMVGLFWIAVSEAVGIPFAEVVNAVLLAAAGLLSGILEVSCYHYNRTIKEED